MFNVVGTVLAWIYASTHNYGLAIMLLTMAIMVVLTPLTLKGTRSMLAMTPGELFARINAIQVHEAAQWARERHLAAIALWAHGLPLGTIDRLLPGWRKSPPKMTAAKARKGQIGGGMAVERA